MHFHLLYILVQDDHTSAIWHRAVMALVMDSTDSPNLLLQLWQNIHNHNMKLTTLIIFNCIVQ